MMFTILFFLLGSIQLSSAIPQPVVHRQAGQTTLLPTKDPLATYAVDLDWTVTVTQKTVAPDATAVRIAAITSGAAVTATLMGIKSSGTFYWPPPEVTATVGDRIRIKLKNELSTLNANNQQEEVTLHFHGLYQEDWYGFMDGPENIAQCGINKDETFVYDFPVTRAGTYWIHSHDPGQYPKGLRTALIIKDKIDPGYAADNTVTLSDWYPDFWTAEKTYHLKPCGNGVEVLGPTFAATFNDYVPGIHDTKSRFYQIKNGSNRFRFINLSALSPFFIQFEDHKVTVIELDGVLVDAPTDTEGFVVMPGQRASVIVKSVAGRTSGNYRIVAAIDPRFVPNVPGRQNCVLPNRDQSVTAYTWGCFYYGSTAPDECRAPEESKFPFVKYQLDEPLGNRRMHLTLNALWHWDMQTPAAYPWDYNEKLLSAKADQPGFPRDSLVTPKKENVHFLYFKDYSKSGDSQNAGYGSMNFGTEANELWVAPPADKGPGFLRAVQVSNTNPTQKSSYGADSNTIVVEKKNDIVWLLIETGNGDHPMHLHGHHFQLLYRGFEDPASITAYRAAVSAYKSSGDTAPPEWEKFRAAVERVTPAKPVTRDTILALKHQFMIIAFRATNPGVWALHCHNDFHASTGMMKQVIVAPVELRSRVGTWDISGNTISYVKPLAGKVPQAVVDSLLRNVQQCHPGSSLPPDADWH